MPHGFKEEHMPLVTRLDGRSDKNNSFHIKDADGKDVAIITTNNTKVELSIEAKDGAYITKPNGFSSKKD